MDGDFIFWEYIHALDKHVLLAQLLTGEETLTDPALSSAEILNAHAGPLARTRPSDSPSSLASGSVDLNQGAGYGKAGITIDRMG